jgi:hypothetical protein
MDQFATIKSIQSQMEKLYPISEPASGTPPPPLSPGFLFRPMHGHTMTVAGTTATAPDDLRAFCGGTPEIRLFGPSLVAFGIGVRFELGGHTSPWWTVHFAWIKDPRRSQPLDLGGARSVHLLPASATQLDIVLAISGAEVARRKLLLDRHFAMRLNDRVSMATDANLGRGALETAMDILGRTRPADSFDVRFEDRGTGVDREAPSTPALASTPEEVNRGV